jgi:hypothetical protein
LAVLHGNLAGNDRIATDDGVLDVTTVSYIDSIMYNAIDDFGARSNVTGWSNDRALDAASVSQGTTSAHNTSVTNSDFISKLYWTIYKGIRSSIRLQIDKFAGDVRC